eukprot:TRINITY_DN7301_c1_g4_i3.p1 TRINITY_DN7301_c1_g4~~TRINITY_DN7301_c1_g4_i3.p1  ORF type:complete len:144 (-),score=9.55 TRINITY_DN7301_c1_g4_i3:487-918(-)
MTVTPGQASSSHIAESGTYGSAHVTSSSQSPWIIDSGATDHMSGMSHLFSSMSSLCDSVHIRIADGSLVPAQGKGNVKLGSLSLESTFLILKMPMNLMSVSKITNSLYCSVTFFPTHCVFQDLTSGRILGRGIERKGLYLFED